jgi:hypothetical protein
MTSQAQVTNLNGSQKKKEMGLQHNQRKDDIHKIIGWFKIIVGVSVAYNFQIGNNKIKLFTEYESVTQNVLLLL